MNSKMIIKYLDEQQSSSAIETIDKILVYFDQFKIFTTPSENPFDYGDFAFDFENVTRVYDASIMHEQTDILFILLYKYFYESFELYIAFFKSIIVFVLIYTLTDIIELFFERDVFLYLLFFNIILHHYIIMYLQIK
jgi:hypothetical protein